MTMDFFFRSPRGSVDVATVTQHLESLPDVIHDRLEPDMFILCGMVELVPIILEERENDPSRFPYACLVQVATDHVAVLQEYGNTEGLRSARAFVKWLLRTGEWMIEDQLGRDWTEEYKAKGIDVFYPATLASLPDPAWITTDAGIRR